MKKPTIAPARPGAPLSDADIVKLMGANKDAIARIVAQANGGAAPAVETAPDVAAAARHVAALKAALGPVLAALDAAKADGFDAAFGLGAGEDGKQAIVQFTIAKSYAV